VALIVQALQTDPTHLSDYNRFPQIFELAGAIGNAATKSWQDGTALSAASAAAPALFAQIGRSGDPHLEDWPGNGMAVVNPDLVFYGVSWSGKTEGWALLRGKSGWIQLIPPRGTPNVRQDIKLVNGNHTVDIYKGQASLASSNIPEIAAGQANVIKTLLLGLDTLAPPGFNLATGVANNNELIEYLVGNPSEDKDVLLSLWSALNLSEADDWLSVFKKVVELFKDKGAVQRIIRWVYRGSDADSEKLWRYCKSANKWLDGMLKIMKVYDIGNEFAPFVGQFLLNRDHYAYFINVNNGVLTEGWKRIPPSVVLTASTATPRVNQTVSFSATGTTDDSDPLANLYFRWDYDGSGTWDRDWTKGAATDSHAYSTIGPYQCVVEARDSQGLIGSAFWLLYVQPQPGASISINVTPDAGSWRLIGPAGFATVTGTGDRLAGSAITNCPAGQYTLSCNDNVAGYNPPPPETKTLASGGTIAFTPTYTPEGGPNEITINLPGNVPLVLVRIPAGSFQMGSPDTERSRWSNEGPVHTVNIAYAFYMGKYEVTQRQWQVLMGTNPAHDYGVGDNYPVYNVSWNDCQSFITALNTHMTNTGQEPATFRLPSEAEWEYACRAGTQTRFFFGDSLSVDDGWTDGPAGVLPGNRSDYMWFGANNSPYGSKQVGTKLPNQFGLYDMSGNVWEWCQDWYHSSYTGAPTNGNAWESPAGSYRVIRGGNWHHYARNCRSAGGRDYDPPGNRSSYIGRFPFGFRLLRTQ